MKGKVFVDLIVDHAIVEATQNYVGLKPQKLYFDCSKHKNRSGIRSFFISSKEIQTKFKFKIIDYCSNNEAEYEAMIAGLKILLDLGKKGVESKEIQTLF